MRRARQCRARAVAGHKGGHLEAGHGRSSVESPRPAGFAAVLLLALLALLQGCVTAPAPAPGPTSKAAPPPPAPRPLAVLVSSDVPMYREVAHALGTHHARLQVYALAGDERKAEAVTAQLQREDLAGVVAIGSLATRAAARLDGLRVVYCLDFTLGPQRRERDGMRGVRAWPPAAVQLEAWKRLDPGLVRVALVTGEGESALVKEALAAAPQLGIELQHVEVQSDRELLYVVKRLGPEVQGIWFPPDSRVLSAKAVREALAHSLRQGKETLVFSAQLLQFGALLSVEADPRDVAERVLEQLQAGDAAPAVVPLRTGRTAVNLRIARELGLPVPEGFQGGGNVF